MSVVVRVAVGVALMLSLVGCGKADGAGNHSLPSFTLGPSTPGATLSFESDKGAHPVDYRSGEWSTPDNEIMVSEHENVIKIDGEADRGRDYLRVELTGPNKEKLRAERYTDVRDRETFPDHPGMLVISNGLGCKDVYGEFAVDTIEWADSTLVAFDARFVQSCGGLDKPALRGRVHYRK